VRKETSSIEGRGDETSSNMNNRQAVKEKSGKGVETIGSIRFVLMRGQNKIETKVVFGLERGFEGVNL